MYPRGRRRESLSEMLACPVPDRKPDTCVLKANGATKLTAYGQESDFDRVP